MNTQTGDGTATAPREWVGVWDPFVRASRSLPVRLRLRFRDPACGPQPLQLDEADDFERCEDPEMHGAG